ncbi:MAG: MBL fold metallo-hydrolase [Candidatus Falkowbacteria bacterium]|nr:MBL fold metallo-hydrolase [Candidatus Falkowbacteria bacterium]
MKITFFGAAQGVTGSKHLIESNGFKILLDCGLHQGKRQEAYELNKTLPFDAKTIDAVILSHAHADHCGMLPMLVKAGYKNKIFTTPTTADIARLIMLDSAKIQMSDYLHLKNNGIPEKDLLQPLYTTDDVEIACKHFAETPYARAKAGWHELTKGIRFKFYDAGHILGSAVTVIQSDEANGTKTLAFTGDLGNVHVPILNDPELIDEQVDAIISECTYGNRIHRPVGDVTKLLIDVINEAVQHKKKIIVPAFALGRTQELIYVLHKLYDEKKIPVIPIYLDSPLGSDVTDAFTEHYEDFDHETWQDFISHHESPFAFKNLHTITTTEESKTLNSITGPCMIIASSGMCEGGRILHHLEHNVSNRNSIIIITGYQAEHTLGRKLLEGVNPVRIYDRWHELNAKVMTINEFSAHADQAGLYNYISKIKELKDVFLVHSEEIQATTFERILNERLPKLKVIIPKIAESFEI